MEASSGMDGRTAAQVVDGDVSLQKFLKRTMMTTGLGIGASAAATAVFMQMPMVIAHPMITMGVGLVAGIGCIMGINFIPATYKMEGGHWVAVNSTTRKAVFGTFLAAEGLVLAPLLLRAAAEMPIAIPIAGGLALTTMAGMASFALSKPQGSLLKWGPMLSVGIFGLIGVGVVNIFLGSHTMAIASSAIGVGLFSAFTAYDTQLAIAAHNEGKPDHMGHAVSFYLNFVNLFLDFLRLIREFK